MINKARDEFLKSLPIGFSKTVIRTILLSDTPPDMGDLYIACDPDYKSFGGHALEQRVHDILIDLADKGWINQKQLPSGSFVYYSKLEFRIE